MPPRPNDGVSAEMYLMLVAFDDKPSVIVASDNVVRYVAPVDLVECDGALLSAFLVADGLLSSSLARLFSCIGRSFLSFLRRRGGDSPAALGR